MKTRAVFVGVSILVVYGLVIVRATWLPGVSRWLDVGTSLRSADVVFALPGDAERRPFVAAALVNAGFAERTIIIENVTSPDEEDGIVPRTHVVTRKIYEARGLPPHRILQVQSKSSSTADDLDAIRHFLDENRGMRVCLVTNAFHTRRTRATIRSRLPAHSHLVHIFSAPNPGFDDENWWQTPDGLDAVLSEYLKHVWYFLRFGHGGWVVIGLIATIIAVATYIYGPRRRRATSPLRFS